MYENSSLSPRSAARQIDRIITWPGQLTAYWVGEDTIRSLRRKLENKQRNFDLKKFHSKVLRCYGALDTLEACVTSDA